MPLPPKKVWVNSFYKTKKRNAKRKKMKELQNYRRANHLCITCGKPAAQDRVRCEYHLIKRRQSNKNSTTKIIVSTKSLSSRCKKKETCRWCTFSPEPGMTLCKQHSIDLAPRHSKIMPTNSVVKETESENFSLLKWKRAVGICLQCSKLALDGDQYCIDHCCCTSQLQKLRKKLGMCLCCSSSVFNGQIVCKKHFFETK